MMIMSGLTKLMLSSILITVIVLGLCNPVAAQQPPPPKISLEPSTITINPCEEFTLTLWIRDIPDGWAMVQLDLRLEWDPDLMELVDEEPLCESRGWTEGGGSCGPGCAEGDSSGPQWTEDAPWGRVTFHCLGEGISVITLSSPGLFTIYLQPVGQSDTPTATFPEPFEVTVNQVERAPVGGISTPINKLEILTPYIALAGLIAAVSTVYVIKRRKD